MADKTFTDIPEFELKNLLSYQDLQKFCTKSTWEGIKQCLLHTSLLLFSGYLIHCTLPWSGWLGFILFFCAEMLHAFFMSFLFMPLHEATHNTVFEDHTANLCLAWITGFLTVRFPKYYMVYHFPHHRYTGDPNKDPELLDTLIDMKMSSLKHYIIYLSGIPFWIDRILIAVQLCRGDLSNAPWVIDSKKVCLYGKLDIYRSFILLLLTGRLVLDLPFSGIIGYYLLSLDSHFCDFIYSLNIQDAQSLLIRSKIQELHLLIGFTKN